MKASSIRLLSLAICLSSVVLFGNTIIKNPKNPTKKNYGRPIPLKVVSTFEDDGETFFFKWPSNIKIAANGNIFVVEQDQLIQLNPQGKFIRNFWKKGQGAAEMVDLSNYFLLPNDEVITHNTYPNKILVFDESGKCIHEKRLIPNKYMIFFHQNKDNYYFYKEEVPDTKGNAKEIAIDIMFYSISKRDNSNKKMFSLPIVSFVYNSPTQYARVQTTPLLIRHFKDNLFFISNTPEYQIKLIDLNTSDIVMTFNRDYDRVKVTKENEDYVRRGGFLFGDKVYQSPIPEYLHDIQGIHTVEGKLWAITNTVTEKGVLVDVFDHRGKYIDNFYLKFQFDKSLHKLFQNQLAIDKNNIYLIEKNPDEDYVITKYEMQPDLLP